MRFVKKNERSFPEVSLIFLDWSVRESFHVLHYLAQQSVSRDRFEVIVVEYYSRVSDAIRIHEDQVDKWLLLEMPADVYYHKHLMYNAGIALSCGKIIVISDSDAMVRKTFLESILRAFQKDERIVLHLDQFRNNRRDLYPFNYPDFAEVVGEGCINHVNGRTVGVRDTADPLHTRNYGACMCALRDDLIAIGGADEHIDYLGHICGPYELTFRLVNYGRREVWLDDEFTYHTWHPGQAGEGNYVGPHDGKQLSSKALEARRTSRIFPFVENPLMQMLRQKGECVASDTASLLSRLVSKETLRTWSVAEIALRRSSLKKRFLLSRSLLVNLQLFATLTKIVTRQFWIKLTRVPRKVTSPRIFFQKIIGVYSFFQNAYNHNFYVTQLARQILDELAQQGVRSIAIYGTGEIAEILLGLSMDAPVKVHSIYDDFGGSNFLGFNVLPIESGKNEEMFIVAAVVGVDEKIVRLTQLGVERSKIAVLQ